MDGSMAKDEREAMASPFHVSDTFAALANAWPHTAIHQAALHEPGPMRDFATFDSAMTDILSLQLRFLQMWFVAVMSPHRVEGLPLAGASQHDLPAKPLAL